MPCTANEDCPPDAICCDGSDESCDGTRMPSGDGGNPGEFVVSADGLTVTDTITGLVWQVDDLSPRTGCTGSSPNGCTWKEAQAYCASLVLGGLSGWRLPAGMESLTILDLTGAPNPNGFPGGVGRDWTSLSWGSYGLYLDSYYDNLLSCDDEHQHVRCVRGSRCYPNSRFVALTGGLVRDTLTGLVWQAQGGPTAMAWSDAQSYCSSLGVGFRLPTYRELLTLLGRSSGPTTAFPGGVPGPFWTSTPDGSPCGDSSDCARFGGFWSPRNSCESADLPWAAVSTALNVRCVR